ncbi:MAG TPA: hypothetical protein EYQ43_06260 [Methyloprofundus sp.]|jgi:hypothetical protein|uniref:hypothetical protein n=1 Tax=Methyloprofundus sp. TaxID=2020875 RepID=UPI0018452ACF|nr:hypothetical protein [Methyloprofundus sp.]HIG65152.1 hypothetical protein [Methyloprofundus sp.]HIL79096.1 hypothetical protein [Methylococcales bacterium]
MRFFVTGEQNRQLLLNSLILMFLGYILLLWISNGLMYFHKMDLTPGSVISYYLGSEQDFTQPKSYQSMLEVSHFHVFSMGLLVLTLTHLMIMTNLSVPIKVWVSSMVYISAIADEAAGWLVRFVHPDFAYFKIGSFLVLEISLMTLIILVTVSLFYARRKM